MTEDFFDDRTRSNIGIASGVKISHYEIVQKIGAGGMGEVYLAEDTELKRKVALKILPMKFGASDDSRKRFRREAQAAAALNHPRIVTIYEVGEYKECPFIAMEFVEGQTLHDYLKFSDCSLDTLIVMAIQICEGLQEAHSKGIIHRDIKPINILIDKNSRPKILDFGLAAFLGTEPLTKSGVALGTVGYMSPELINGEQADSLTDIFSFGIVFYEMLTGINPFKNKNEAATMYAIVHETPESISKYRPDIPGPVQKNHK